MENKVYLKQRIQRFLMKQPLSVPCRLVMAAEKAQTLEPVRPVSWVLSSALTLSFETAMGNILKLSKCQFLYSSGISQVVFKVASMSIKIDNCILLRGMQNSAAALERVSHLIKRLNVELTYDPSSLPLQHKPKRTGKIHFKKCVPECS